MTLCKSLTLYFAFLFSLTTSGLQAQEVKKLKVESRTSADFSELIQDRAAKQFITATLYLPTTGTPPFKTIVAAHGSGGVGPNEELFKTYALEAGFAYVVVDSFVDRGVSSTATNQASVSYSSQVADALYTLKLLATESQIDIKKVGIFGLSRGGMVAHFAAHKPLMDAVVGPELSFAGHFSLTPACNARLDKWVVKPGAPVFIALGEKDDYTPPSSCQPLIDRLKDAGADLQIKVYPDAFHAFAHLAGRVFYAPRVQRISTDKPCQIVTGSDGVTSIVTEGLEPGTVAVNGDWGRFFNDWLGRCGTLGGTVGSNRDHRPQIKQDFQEFFSKM